MSKEIVITVPQFPEQRVLITLFTNVKNSASIKNELIKGNSKYDYSFINASLILTLEQLFASVHKTILDSVGGRMKSKSINSELILNLSPFTGISDSFKKIGLTEKTENLILVKFLSSDDDISSLMTDLQDIIEGDLQSLDDESLIALTDFKNVKKIFKLNQIQDDDRSKLSRLIIGITQLK